MHPSNTSSRSRAGFTLSEILLAMLVFAIAISTILALLARSIEAVDEIVLKDEAMRLSSALERDLQSRAFNDVFGILQANQPSPVVLQALHHRVVSDRQTPRPDRTGVVGQDYFVVPFVDVVAPPDVFQARDGRLFAVRLQVSPTNPLGVTLPANPNTYESAAIVIFAEFIPIAAPGQTPAGNPVYAYNFAVRR